MLDSGSCEQKPPSACKVSPPAPALQGPRSFGNLQQEVQGALAALLQLQVSAVSALSREYTSHLSSFSLSRAVCQEDQVAADASDCYLSFHKLTLHLQGDKE